VAKKVSKVIDAKIKFKTHGGTDLEDTLFTSFSIFTFGVKGEAKAAASELKKNHGEVKRRYRANQIELTLPCQILIDDHYF